MTNPRSLATVALLASLLVLLGAQGASDPLKQFHDATGEYDHILRQTVRDDGLVDYDAIERTYATSLDAYLIKLGEIDANNFPRDEKLAYYINLYNATMLKAALDRRGGGWAPDKDDFAVFKLPLVRSAGVAMSLNDLEHEVIRKRFDEPRVHAALVCAARSCPPLLPRAYRADDLDRVLEENMQRFVRDPARNPIDVANRKLVLSKIFDWYAADFGGPDKVAAYVDRYHPAETTGWPVSFTEYSWQLNDLAGGK
jgi:hypothetical protein